jgi:hypothetical protein
VALWKNVEISGGFRERRLAFFGLAVLVPATMKILTAVRGPAKKRLTMTMMMTITEAIQEIAVAEVRSSVDGTAIDEDC